VKARIEELTPPGIAALERANIVAFDRSPAPTQVVATQPAAAQSVG
jgi:hypothetical protein